jgi:putative addiction module CopG family antidote
MHVELTPEQNSYIDLGIQEGRFRSREEAVRQALALWEKRERARIELLASLDMAEKSLDAGEGEEYPPENLNQLISSIEERGRTRLNGQ